MMTDRVPFEELKRDCAVALKVIQGIVPSTHEDEQLAQVKRLCDLMRDCWKIKPENRLHASQCCRQIKWIVSLVFIASWEISNGLLRPAVGPARRWNIFIPQGNIAQTFTSDGRHALLTS